MGLLLLMHTPQTGSLHMSASLRSCRAALKPLHLIVIRLFAGPAS